MGLLGRLGSALWPRAGAADGVGLPSADDDFWYGPAGALTGAGIRVTPQRAIKASAVYACVSLLAEVMAAVPLHMLRKLERGREPAPNHPLEDLIAAQPNEVDTAYDFWCFMHWHATLRGVAYAEIVAGPRGPVDQLIPLHPDLVTAETYGDPRRPRWRYRVRYPGGGERVLLAEEMFRLPGLITGGVRGMGLVEHADEAIAIALAADQYAARVFSNGLNHSYVISHPGKLSREAKDNLLSQIMKRAAGVLNLHRPLVLQEGMAAEKVSMTARDAQMEEARKFQILELARRLRIPPHMLGITDGATHSNVEEQSLNFVRYTLLPIGTRVEQAIRRDLIVDPRQYTAKYNFEGLLRGNSQARADYFSKALGSGGSPAWMSVDEVRAIEGLNTLGGPEYALPPLGTNPSNRDPAEGGRLGPAGGAALAAPQRIAPPRSDPAAALVRKETAVLRKAVMRFADDVEAWRRYARSFYGGHVSDVMQRLGVSKELAGTYCRARAAQCAAEAPLAVLEHLENHGIAEAARLVDLAREKAA
jgi:HK97 family phage portal protein